MLMVGDRGSVDAGIDGPAMRDGRHEADDGRVQADDGRRNRYVDG
jgi:hypothetical protein